MSRLLRSSVKKDARRVDIRGEYRPHSVRLSAPHFAAGCPPIRGSIVGSASDFPLPVTIDPPFKFPTHGGTRENLSSRSNYLRLAGKSLKSPAMERIGTEERIFAEYSVTAPATRISKPLRKHGIFQAHPGLRACLRKGRWRSKGNREGETLCPLLFSIFNTFLEEGSFLDWTCRGFVPLL